MSTPLHFVILAAGKGTRMKSELPKVLHAVGGEPMIVRILRTASHFSPVTSTVVVGHMADKVRAALAAFPGVGTVVQEPQLGTGHALLQAQPPLAGQTGTVVLLYGDVPMLAAGTISRLLDHHAATGAAATVLTAHLANPTGLRPHRPGRTAGWPGSSRSATRPRRSAPSREFNSGIYAFALDGLFEALGKVGTANDQGEYYLTDLVGIFRAAGRVVETVCLESPDELRGVNSRAELASHERPGARRAQRGGDGVGRDADRSVVDVDRARRRDRAGHDDPPRRLPRRPDAHRRQLRDPRRRARDQLDDRRRHGGPELLRDPRFARGRERGDGTVLAPPARQPTSAPARTSATSSR